MSRFSARRVLGRDGAVVTVALGYSGRAYVDVFGSPLCHESRSSDGEVVAHAARAELTLDELGALLDFLMELRTAMRSPMV